MQIKTYLANRLTARVLFVCGLFFSPRQQAAGAKS